MKRKIISICLMIALISVSVFTLAACGNQSAYDGADGADGAVFQNLRIFNTGLHLTQDQVASQIKADYLKQNKGYLDSDKIVVMVMLDDDALIDDYIDNYSGQYRSVAEYASSDVGNARKAYLQAKRNFAIDRMSKNGLLEDVKCTYDTILNGFAATIEYGNLRLLENFDGVKTVIISDTYNHPQSASSDSDAKSITNLVDIYPTGIFDSSSVPYTGKRTSVAILDSGFDCDHTVFDMELKADEISYTKEDIENLLGDTNAAKYTSDIDIDKVYVSSKIPFAYDYADKDTNVDPYDSEHGTHVAGIIGGKDSVITGVAVDTQLVLMKVFPDLSTGGKTEDILLALEDAVLLNVDCINMSLGSSCGFSREVDEENVNRIYDRLNESGISVLTAASNSYSTGFGGEQGNTNMVTNPDSGTVGSPSTYAPCLSVASISGTKSKYMVGNGESVIFFKESNSITGQENDFFKELGVTEGVSTEYEYVTVPGTGGKTSYTGLDVKGKIALVRRGDNTFEEKARYAKNAGAVACIIYNNIDGDISMSMGKSDHIPTISISKDDGTILAAKKSGTLKISYDNQAGPFMSDFSSWGPTPSLELKPEITAHGGNIKSSVPGGGYDELSGTSMATPNLCGIVVLIRQFLKDKYPEKSWKEISVLTNQMLMSTATIALNESGNPYSPRKQGAGLASLKNLVTTRAYLSVDGKDRTKIELFDDPQKTGVYVMNFNVVNIGKDVLTYDLSLVGMTESVSTSDAKHVAETPQILEGVKHYEVTGGNGTIDGQALTVQPGATVKIKVTYTLTDSEKNVIDSLFPYGMYVEGFVKLKQTGEETEDKKNVDLNVPFLAFYGDWTEAPMFDKTYYEVESEAHDMSIDDEDKIKADYYATTPYGSYFYNYIIPLGTYLYDVDTTKYDEIPASEEHIAVSNILGTIDGISVVYAGLLRGAKEMRFTITDKATGEVIWEHIDYNATKSYSYGGSPLPYYEQLKFKSLANGLVNNAEYTFEMKGTLDYGDGGAAKNVRNSFGFDFVADDEAPVIKSVTYEKQYDKTLKKDRFYVNMVVYDNQYVQSITPILFTSSSSYTFLTQNPIPVYSEKGKDNLVRFEITDYLKDIGTDALITSALAFSIDDYALNSNIFICQLPGTKGDFKFTKDGTPDGTDLIILSAYEDEVIDLTQYLATSDGTVDVDKDYLKYLSWTSSNENVIEVKDGLVKCIAEGKATVTVREQMNLNQAVVIINVKKRESADAQSQNDCEAFAATASYATTQAVEDDYKEATLKDLRFSYYDTLFAYSRAAQTSEIGKTGDRRAVASAPNIGMYPGEKIQLNYDVDPWYVKDNYEFEYSSNNTKVAQVNEKGEVTALKKGSAIIVIKAKNSYIQAAVTINVKSEFVIENRELIAYKGLGGNVVIPDDEGILYIGAFAFCLYETDNSIEIDEDDYDANKIPASNTSVTSVVIPKGVEEIKKYAFYNCTGLREVTIPDSVKYIREYAFYNDRKLETVKVVKEDGTVVENNDLSASKVETIGANAFANCKALATLNLKNVLSIGANAFDGCVSLTSADLTSLRNTGKEAFKGCTALTSVTLVKNTKLSYAMFAKSGLRSVDIYSERTTIPEYCFARCSDLVSVTLHNNLNAIEKGAFSDCPSLINFTIEGTLGTIGEQAFYNSTGLESFALPNCDVQIDSYAFYKCGGLKTLVFGANTRIKKIEGFVFKDTVLDTFVMPSSNPNYSSSGRYLTSKDGKTIVLAAAGVDYGDLTIDEKYTTIADSAFAGVNVTSLTITNKDLQIGAFAFASCENLKKVTLPTQAGVNIGKRAFTVCTSLVEVENLDKVAHIGEYAFANTALQTASVGANAVCDEGAFYNSSLESVTIGANATLGKGVFQNCKKLRTVNMPADGGVEIGNGCFANDTNLVTIDLSKTSDTIGDEAFYGCTKLMSVNLANVKNIGKYAFADCSGLGEVLIPIVETIGQGAFGRYSQFASAPCFETIVLPNTLKFIGEGAFVYNKKLKSVTIPSSVTSIGEYAFAYCTALQSVTLPDNVTEIPSYMFGGCESLSAINLENVTKIGDYAFTLASLTTANIDKAVSIGEGAFAQTGLSRSISASKLENIGKYAFQATNIILFNAPALKTIGDSAFEKAIMLASFTFSNKLESVGVGAFYGCSSLRNFSFLDKDGNVAQKGAINDYALLYEGSLYVKLASGKYELKAVPGGSYASVLNVMDGTVRIDDYAGNSNTHIASIVLPDGLKRIGQYAFYGYTALKSVEFKSVVAPAMEDSYKKDAKLTENDPGYEKLHNQFDIFGYELYYFNFIDLLGKKEPIQMILPGNADVEGYDSLVYEVYFGKVEDALRSDYVAMQNSMLTFYEYAQQVAKLKNVTLVNEKLVNNALTAYNSVTQDPTTYGFDKEEWDALVASVQAAKNTIRNIKFANASDEVKRVQALIDELPDTFSIDDLATIQDVLEQINQLDGSDRNILDLTKLNALKTSYNDYRNSLAEQVEPLKQSTDNLGFAVILFSTSLALAGAVLVIKRGIL